jgi:tRNA U34 5-carboxymethylaminomethyl modifying GTPase MnmE/TrmE
LAAENAFRLLTSRAEASELVAEEWRAGVKALGEITGETFATDLLDTIFSSFCIGK